MGSYWRRVAQLSREQAFFFDETTTEGEERRAEWLRTPGARADEARGPRGEYIWRARPRRRGGDAGAWL